MKERLYVFVGIICFTLLFSGITQCEQVGNDDLFVHYIKSGGFADIFEELTINSDGSGGKFIFESSLGDDFSGRLTDEKIQEIQNQFENANFCEHCGNYPSEQGNADQFFFELTYVSIPPPCKSTWDELSLTTPNEILNVSSYLDDFITDLN